MSKLGKVREKILAVRDKLQSIVGVDTLKRVVRVSSIEEADALFEVSVLWKLDGYCLTMWGMIGGRGLCIDIWRLSKEVDPDDE